MMSRNGANTISKHGQRFEGTPPQGKDLHNSLKLSSQIAKLILSNKSLKKVPKKDRSSEKSTLLKR